MNVLSLASSQGISRRAGALIGLTSRAIWKNDWRLPRWQEDVAGHGSASDDIKSSIGENLSFAAHPGMVM
jgi:hypothetical protein